MASRKDGIFWSAGTHCPLPAKRWGTATTVASVDLTSVLGPRSGAPL